MERSYITYLVLTLNHRKKGDSIKLQDMLKNLIVYFF